MAARHLAKPSAPPAWPMALASSLTRHLVQPRYGYGYGGYGRRLDDDVGTAGRSENFISLMAPRGLRRSGFLP